MTSPSETSSVEPRRLVSFPLAARLAFFLFLFGFWFFRYGDFLYVAQGYDLFLWRWSFFAEAIRPAELSLRLSAFFVQFFYYPALGAAILAGFSAFIQYETERLFRLNGRLFPLSFVPATLLTLQITSVGYYVFEYCDVAFVFSFLFQYSFALAFATLFDSLKSERGRAAFLAIGGVVCFPIFGVFALLAAFFCLLKEATRPDAVNAPASKRRRRLVFLALWTLAVPTLYWPRFSGTASTLGALYAAGLSEGTVFIRDPETQTLFDALLKATLVFFVGAALADAARLAVGRKRLERPARSVRSPRRDKKTPVPTERDAAAKRSSSVDSATLISALVVLTLAVAVVRFSFYNPDFGALCRIARALDREDWEEIVRLEAPLAEPSNSVIDARILALSRLGRLGDELYLRPLVPARSPQLVQTASFGMCGDRILYEFGAVNPALRAATNNYVTKRERSAWAAFTLALCNVAEDRRAVAERYLYRLQGTLFHRARAAETAAYLNARSAETSTFTPYLRLAPLSDERRAELDASFAAVRAQKPTVDGFFPNRCVSHSRYYLVQTDDLAKRPLRERETRLATLLLMRDLPTFAEHLDSYLLEKTALKEASERRIPRFIQEAILLRGRFPQAFGRPADERWSVPVELEIDPEIARRFLDYLKTIDASRPQNDIFRDVDLYFRQTFWAEAFSISEVENY